MIEKSCYIIDFSAQLIHETRLQVQLAKEKKFWSDCTNMTRGINNGLNFKLDCTIHSRQFVKVACVQSASKSTLHHWNCQYVIAQFVGYESRG